MKTVLRASVWLLPIFIFLGQGFCQQLAPAYLSLAGSPQDFELFANGGWDGNWYVGYNSMWVVELSSPSAPTGWSHAFIGAKLGRMKNSALAQKNCEIFMAIASIPAWRASDSYFLTTCEDMPLEGSAQDAIKGVGESQWFWREVPLKNINFFGKNYLAIWSPTPELAGPESSPIIAAAGAKDASNAWLNRTIKGAPPSTVEETLETRLHLFAPSLAIKLIPASSSYPVHADILSFYEDTQAFKWEVQVMTTNFLRVRPEISIDGENWIPFGRSLVGPPFVVWIPKNRIQKEAERILPTKRKLQQVYLRITAWNEWEEHGSTSSFVVYIRT